MYPPGFQTWVDVTELGAILEGEYRPGHFRGVATSASSSSTSSGPTSRYFGQKDAQQVAVIRRLVADLDLELELVVVPTVRDADGLALSSRNVRLSPRRARARTRAAPRARDRAIRERARAIARAAGLDVDYVEVAAFDPPVLAAAVRVGSTRLIDNVSSTTEEQS